nr:hypothetical protein [uncultured Albidiferax sp.]
MMVDEARSRIHKFDETGYGDAQRKKAPKFGAFLGGPQAALE